MSMYLRGQANLFRAKIVIDSRIIVCGWNVKEIKYLTERTLEKFPTIPQMGYPKTFSLIKTSLDISLLSYLLA